VPQENVEVVRRAVAALNARDLEGYLACCTGDVELHTPELFAGVYEGPQGMKRFLTDIEDAGPDFHIDVRDLKAVGDDQVLAFAQVGYTGRASRIQMAVMQTNVYDLVDGKIRRTRIFRDHHQALKAVGLEE
jgi:ketosteroid isomerase-like protein